MPKADKNAQNAENTQNAEKTKKTKTQTENEKTEKESTATTETSKKKNKVDNRQKTSKTEGKKEKQPKQEQTQNKSKAKKSEMQIQEKQTEEIQEAVGQAIKENKKIPNEELAKINTSVFKNICLAVGIMLYLNFVILGFINIDNNIFITDLKVFGMALLVISICTFEYAYKKDSGRHIVHGIEILILAFITIALIYVNLTWANKFIYIVAFITYAYAIYYVAKSIILYKKLKKEYFLNAMKEIIKK